MRKFYLKYKFADETDSAGACEEFLLTLHRRRDTFTCEYWSSFIPPNYRIYILGPLTEKGAENITEQLRCKFGKYQL